jgi:hypothetical protein
MADKSADSSAEIDTKCPVCGCDKPKTLIEGRYQCVDCTCTVDSGCQGAVEDG